MVRFFAGSGNTRSSAKLQTPAGPSDRMLGPVGIGAGAGAVNITLEVGAGAGDIVKPIGEAAGALPSPSCNNAGAPVAPGKAPP